MNRLDHSLSNNCITNIIPFLPAGLLSIAVEDGKSESIKSTVLVDSKTLRVKLETLTVLEDGNELTEKNNGTIVSINENDFLIVCTIFLSNSHQPVLLTQDNGDTLSLHSPVDMAKKLGFIVLKRYYDLPDDAKFNNGNHYEVTINIETQKIVSFKTQNCESPISVLKLDDKHAVLTMYAANGGMNVVNSPLREGDEINSYIPVGTQSFDQPFQSIFVSNTIRSPIKSTPYTKCDFEHRRFGKVWYKMDVEELLKKVKSPRIKLDTNTNTFFSWWLNTPVVDYDREEGETPVIFKVIICRDAGDKLFTTEPVGFDDYHCGDLYNGLLPRTINKEWSRDLSPSKIASVLTLPHPLANVKMFNDLDNLYFYEGEEHIATAMVKHLLAKEIAEKISKVDAMLNDLESEKNSLSQQLLRCSQA